MGLERKASFFYDKHCPVPFGRFWASIVYKIVPWRCDFDKRESYHYCAGTAFVHIRGTLQVAQR